MPISKASSSAVAPGAKGQLVVGNATNDSGILAVGANGTVLTADSAEATGVKWAAAGGGSLTLLSTTNIAAAASTTVTSIDQTYTNLIVLVEGVSQTNSGDGIRIAPNSVQTTYSGVIASSASAPSTTTTTDISIYNGFGITSSNTNNVFLCEIFNYASTTQFKPMTMVSSAIASGNPQGSWAAGAWRSTSAITSIQLWTYFSFNAAGTIKIYGVK